MQADWAEMPGSSEFVLVLQNRIFLVWAQTKFGFQMSASYNDRHSLLLLQKVLLVSVTGRSEQLLLQGTGP